MESIKIWFLEQSVPFHKLSREELVELDRLSKMAVYRQGELLFFENEPALHVYLLKKGRIKVFRRLPDGEEIVLGVIEPGMLFGELSLSDEQYRHREAARALSDSLVCIFPLKAFVEFLHKHPRVLFEVTKWMGRRVQTYQQCVSELLFKDAPQRIATLLLRLLEQLPAYQEDSAQPAYEIFPFLTQKDLATLCGVSRQTLSTILNQWRKEGIVDIKRKGLVVKDVARLRQLSNNQVQQNSRAQGRSVTN